MNVNSLVAPTINPVTPTRISPISQEVRTGHKPTTLHHHLVHQHHTISHPTRPQQHTTPPPLPAGNRPAQGPARGLAARIMKLSINFLYPELSPSDFFVLLRRRPGDCNSLIKPDCSGDTGPQVRQGATNFSVHSFTQMQEIRRIQKSEVMDKICSLVRMQLHSSSFCKATCIAKIILANLMNCSNIINRLDQKIVCNDISIVDNFATHLSRPARQVVLNGNCEMQIMRGGNGCGGAARQIERSSGNIAGRALANKGKIFL